LLDERLDFEHFNCDPDSTAKYSSETSFSDSCAANYARLISPRIMGWTRFQKSDIQSAPLTTVDLR
jgi:hypothetical protein